MYTKQVLDHFRNPRNMGSIKDTDAVGQKGNPMCGDVMKIYLKVSKSDEKNTEPKIEDAKFETLGCAAAIAVSSMLTTEVIGKTLEEAKKITKVDILKIAGELPPGKIHCSMLGVEALQDAIDNYKK